MANTLGSSVEELDVKTVPGPQWRLTSAKICRFADQVGLARGASKIGGEPHSRQALIHAFLVEFAVSATLFQHLADVSLGGLQDLRTDVAKRHVETVHGALHADFLPHVTSADDQDLPYVINVHGLGLETSRWWLGGSARKLLFGPAAHADTPGRTGCIVFARVQTRMRMLATNRL